MLWIAWWKTFNTLAEDAEVRYRISRGGGPIERTIGRGRERDAEGVQVKYLSKANGSKVSRWEKKTGVGGRGL